LHLIFAGRWFRRRGLSRGQNMRSVDAEDWSCESASLPTRGDQGPAVPCR